MNNSAVEKVAYSPIESAVVKVTNYSGKMRGFNLDGAPKELQDHIKAMFQHLTQQKDIVEHSWNGAVCNVTDPRNRDRHDPLVTFVGVHVNNLLNWILASGWTLTHVTSASENETYLIMDTYVFQKQLCLSKKVQDMSILHGRTGSI
uniref:Uncharacterized protein n=1 Tax=Chaetoceros debilis TaxID=122233 RepID=A0A7S3V9I8_9STRA